MNKKILKWAVIILAVFALGWVFLNTVAVKETTVINTKDTGDILNDPIAGKALDSISNITNQGNEKEAVFYEKMDKYTKNKNTDDVEEEYVDLTNLRKESKDGVRLVSLNNLDAEERQSALESVNNLKMSGSLSGGKITHEFSILDSKRGKLEEEKTSFEPANNILGSDFDMTSRVYSGAYSQDNGYSSIYRLYENSRNGAKLEFTEIYLDPNNNTVMEIVEETLNRSVNNVPMTFETIQSEELGTVYNAQFNLAGKYYSLSSQGMRFDNFEAVLSGLIDKERSSN